MSVDRAQAPARRMFAASTDAAVPGLGDGAHLTVGAHDGHVVSEAGCHLSCYQMVWFGKALNASSPR